MITSTWIGLSDKLIIRLTISDPTICQLTGKIKKWEPTLNNRKLRSGWNNSDSHTQVQWPSYIGVTSYHNLPTDSPAHCSGWRSMSYMDPCIEFLSQDLVSDGKTQSWCCFRSTKPEKGGKPRNQEKEKHKGKKNQKRFKERNTRRRQKQQGGSWWKKEAIDIIILKIPKTETPNTNLFFSSNLWFNLVETLDSNIFIFGGLVKLANKNNVLLSCINEKIVKEIVFIYLLWPVIPPLWRIWKEFLPKLLFWFASNNFSTIFFWPVTNHWRWWKPDNLTKWFLSHVLDHVQCPKTCHSSHKKEKFCGCRNWLLQFANNVDQEHKKRSLYRKRGEKNFRKHGQYTCSTTILSPVNTTARDVFLIETSLRSFQERNYYDSKDGGRQIDKKKQQTSTKQNIVTRQWRMRR